MAPPKKIMTNDPMTWTRDRCREAVRLVPPARRVGVTLASSLADLQEFLIHHDFAPRDPEYVEAARAVSARAAARAPKPADPPPMPAVRPPKLGTKTFVSLS